MKLAFLLACCMVGTAQNPAITGLNDAIDLANRVRLNQALSAAAPQKHSTAAEVKSIDRAIARVRSRHSDFDAFRVEMARLAEILQAGKFRTDELVEILYLAAKHSSFSQHPKDPPAKRPE